MQVNRLDWDFCWLVRKDNFLVVHSDRCQLSRGPREIQGLPAFGDCPDERYAHEKIFLAT